MTRQRPKGQRLKKTEVSNLQQYKSRFTLIVAQTLAFASSTIFFTEIKSFSSKFKQTA